MNKSGSNIKLLGLICIIFFVVYNAAVFAFAGFADHTGTFWCSYLFMLLGFVGVAACALLARSKDIKMRDWIFGYPIFFHCALYLGLELVVSILFMVLEHHIPAGVAFALQLILMGVSASLITTCFITRDTVVAVDQKVRVSTEPLKVLKADVETVASHASDPAVKQAFTKLAEQIRFSDPMSTEALSELEAQMTMKVAQARGYVDSGNNEEALKCCEQTLLLLLERNRKCKAMK